MTSAARMDRWTKAEGHTAPEADAATAAVARGSDPLEATPAAHVTQQAKAAGHAAAEASTKGAVVGGDAQAASSMRLPAPEAAGGRGPRRMRRPASAGSDILHAESAFQSSSQSDPFASRRVSGGSPASVSGGVPFMPDPQRLSPRPDHCTCWGSGFIGLEGWGHGLGN